MEVTIAYKRPIRKTCKASAAGWVWEREGMGKSRVVRVKDTRRILTTNLQVSKNVRAAVVNIAFSGERTGILHPFIVFVVGDSAIVENKHGI